MNIAHRNRIGRRLVAAALCLPLAAGLALAEPVAGDKEIQGGLGFFHAQGSDTGTLNADGSFGYYLMNPAWQIGARQSLNYAFVDNGPDAWTATTAPFVRYHVLGLHDQIVPYVGGFVGGVWNDRDITGTIGPDAGVKFFVNDTTFVGLGYRYEWFFNDLDLGGVTDNTSDGNHVATVGIGFLWGGDDRIDRGAQLIRRTENAAARAENAADRAEVAADRTERAADRLETVAEEAERGFMRGVRK